jgi:hypothetical protein
MHPNTVSTIAIYLQRLVRRLRVTLVGEYTPTQFEFRDDAYWQERKMAVSARDGRLKVSFS